MLDTRHIGQLLAAGEAEVEKGRLRFFAKATGQRDPVYVDEAAAAREGYSSLPVPPTFLFCLEMEACGSRQLCDLFGIGIGQLLHGEQHFSYHAPAVAGDVLRFTGRISDVYHKKDGALGFIAVETRVTNQQGIHVADMRRTVVVRMAAGSTKA
jgi:acyl dehydratase